MFSSSGGKTGSAQPAKPRHPSRQVSSPWGLLPAFTPPLPRGLCILALDGCWAHAQPLGGLWSSGGFGLTLAPTPHWTFERPGACAGGPASSLLVALPGYMPWCLEVGPWACFPRAVPPPACWPPWSLTGSSLVSAGTRAQRGPRRGGSGQLQERLSRRRVRVARPRCADGLRLSAREKPVENVGLGEQV